MVLGRLRALVRSTAVAIAITRVIPRDGAAGEHAEQEGHEPEQASCTRDGVLAGHLELLCFAGRASGPPMRFGAAGWFAFQGALRHPSNATLRVTCAGAQVGPRGCPHVNTQIQAGYGHG